MKDYQAALFSVAVLFMIITASTIFKLDLTSMMLTFIIYLQVFSFMKNYNGK